MDDKSCGDESRFAEPESVVGQDAPVKETHGFFHWGGALPRGVLDMVAAVVGSAEVGAVVFWSGVGSNG